ncbi:hypothetical protein HA050_11315 [Iodobacter sp. HSC-16F04]|uniref:GAF domain-containing protein n=1 Tax=Iodobacter violaceini TaxID=3044271 RepID=A0ABX0KS82_9NEIS|nr:hypothetical protein [Iodobacter violacea]NHQ86706.1 hypothetical protein [Iodobacter violacea]
MNSKEKNKTTSNEYLELFKELWHRKWFVLRRIIYPLKVFISWIDSILENWFISKIISPIFITIPPAITLLYYTKNPAKDWIVKNSPPLSQFLNEHAATMLLFSVLWLPIWQRVRDFIKYAGSSPIEVSAKNVTLLLAAFENIVAFKNKRFSDAARQIISGKSDAESIFNLITQPESQIEETVQQIYTYFVAFDPLSKYKINLAIIDNSEVKLIKFYYPRTAEVRTPIDILNNENSGIRIAARTGKMVIIEDVEHEQSAPKARYVTSPDIETKPGSLICYPIKSGINSKVVFVVSIFCETPKKFKEDKEFKKYYNELLKHFGVRLTLEHNLLVLKGAVNAQS